MYIIFIAPKRVINIISLKSYFFTFRVLETVRSVPASKMDCSVYPAVPKAFQEATTG